MKNILVITGVAISLFASSAMAAVPAPRVKPKPRTERPAGSPRVNEAPSIGSNAAPRPGLGTSSETVPGEQVFGTAATANKNKAGASCSLMAELSKEQKGELSMGADLTMFDINGVCNSGEPLKPENSVVAADVRSKMLGAYLTGVKAGLTPEQAMVNAKNIAVQHFGSEEVFQYVGCGKLQKNEQTGKVEAVGNCLSLNTSNPVLCGSTAVH
jgi:hypothetical protein